MNYSSNDQRSNSKNPNNLPFCSACRRMIIDFVDIYKRIGLILSGEMDNIELPRMFYTT